MRETAHTTPIPTHTPYLALGMEKQLQFAPAPTIVLETEDNDLLTNVVAGEPVILVAELNTDPITFSEWTQSSVNWNVTSGLIPIPTTIAISPNKYAFNVPEADDNQPISVSFSVPTETTDKSSGTESKQDTAPTA
jgi:hypothetical protein